MLFDLATRHAGPLLDRIPARLSHVLRERLEACRVLRDELLRLAALLQNGLAAPSISAMPPPIRGCTKVDAISLPPANMETGFFGRGEASPSPGSFAGLMTITLSPPRSRHAFSL